MADKILQVPRMNGWNKTSRTQTRQIVPENHVADFIPRAVDDTIKGYKNGITLLLKVSKSHQSIFSCILLHTTTLVVAYLQSFLFVGQSSAQHSSYPQANTQAVFPVQTPPLTMPQGSKATKTNKSTKRSRANSTAAAKRPEPPKLNCIICEKQPEVHNSKTEKNKHLAEAMHTQFCTLLNKLLTKKPKGGVPDAKDLETKKDHTEHKCLVCKDKKWTKADKQTELTPFNHLTQNDTHKTKMQNLWKDLQRRLSEASMDKYKVPAGWDAFYTPGPARKSL